MALFRETVMGKDIKYNNSTKSFSEKHDDIDVAIGDDRDDSIFQEQLKLRFNKKWSNEFSVSARLVTDGLFDSAISDRKIDNKDGKIISTSDKHKVEYYDVKDGKEQLITLYEKPKDGKIALSLKTKGCDLIEQPPLTDEYKSGWSDFYKSEIEVSETQVKTKSGLVLVNRPENMINSFAIYNNQNLHGRFTGNDGGYNYYQGKLGHIHRIGAILPDGTLRWLKATLNGNNISIDIPDGLMNDGSLFTKGLVIDPTLGYTTVGGTSQNYANYIIGPRFINTNTTNTAESMSVYLGGSSTSNFVMGTYLYGWPNWTLKSQVAAFTTASGWNTKNFNSQFTLESNSYVLAWLTSSSDVLWYYDSVNNDYTYYFVSYSYNATLPASQSLSYSDSKIHSVYMTHNAASTQTFIPKTYYINE